jgi:mono/diheme cytochrome c family protein
MVMKRHLLGYMLLVSACLVSVSTTAVAQAPRVGQSQVDIGKIEYEAKCASCHGIAARGDGPTAPYLTRKPPDMTTLAKANNGILPVAVMYQIIEGEKQVPGHGTREMPAWSDFYVESPFVVPETFRRARILALIEYINRLQAK